MTSLTTLDLGGYYYNEDRLIDISPLSGLTSLTTLDLSWNQIIDISPLSGLTSLTTLDLRGNGMEINFNESTTTAGKNAQVIKDHIGNGCRVFYDYGNTVRYRDTLDFRCLFVKRCLVCFYLSLGSVASVVDQMNTRH